MHICFLNMQIEYYSPISGGAIATGIMQHARNFVNLGHQVSVLTITSADETYAAGEVIPLDGRSRESLNFVQRRLSSLRRRLQSWDYPYYEYYWRSCRKALERLCPAPDVIVLHNDFVTPRYLKRILPNTKVVLVLHNEQRTSLRDKARATENVDLFLPVSRYIQEWTASNYPIPPVKFGSSWNGVDLEAFTPRVDFLEPSIPLRVLFIGRIDPNKGPDIAADAVTELRKEGIPISLTVAGGLWFYGHGDEMNDPYFRLLKSKMDAAEASCLGHVVRADVPKLIRDHDVVCVLSRSQEPFSLVALEAMASGCAVVASNRGGLPEACGGAAVLLDPDDFSEVVNQLRSLATDPSRLKALKMKSYERAQAEAWSAKTEALEAVLKRELELTRATSFL